MRRVLCPNGTEFEAVRVKFGVPSYGPGAQMPCPSPGLVRCVGARDRVAYESEPRLLDCENETLCVVGTASQSDDICLLPEPAGWVGLLCGLFALGCLYAIKRSR